MSMFEKNIGIVRRRKNGGASAGKGVVFRHMLVAAGVFVGGFTLAGTGSAAVVPTNDYKINFLIDPDGTLLNPPELVHMTLTTDTMLHSGIGAFMGYQVLAISGNSNGDAIGGPLALEFAPAGPPVFYPDINPGPFLVADNLFNPSGYPNGSFVDAAGIGFFDTISGDQYQLANDPEGSVSGGRTVRVRVIPEPSTWVLMALGFGGLGFAAFRHARRAGAPAIV